MIRTSNSSLLALCGVLYGVISIIYFVMETTNGPLTAGVWGSTIMFLGELTLAAGACSIAVGIWRSSTAERWPLLLNGAALAALGLIYCFLVRRYPISLLTIALLMMLMAISSSIFEFINVRRQSHIARRWFLRVAGGASIGCALTLLALGLKWIKLSPGSNTELLWFAFYFGLSAICMFVLAMRPARINVDLVAQS